MRKTILAAALVLAAAIGASKLRAAVDLSTTNNTIPDTNCLYFGQTSSSICGSTVQNYLRMSGGATGSNALNLSNNSVGVNTTSPTGALQVVSPAAATVGLNVQSAVSPTANIAQYTISGSTAVVIGPQGHHALRQYYKSQIDTLVPDGIGDMIVDINGSFSYNVCISTGLLAAQWFAVVQSTGGVGAGGVVGGTHQSGCGSNN